MLRLEVSQDTHRVAREDGGARQLGLPIPVRVGSLSFGLALTGVGSRDGNASG